MEQPIFAAREGIGAGSQEESLRRFARVYQELFPPLYGYVHFRVRDQGAAEDLTSQIFERALSRLASVREPDRIRAWLFAVARNAVTDYWRRRRIPAGLEAVETCQRLWVDSPEDEALRRDEVRLLLEVLGERERDLIELKFVAGLTNPEIARIMGLSEANVAQILHRAVDKLRRRRDEEALR